MGECEFCFDGDGACACSECGVVLCLSCADIHERRCPDCLGTMVDVPTAGEASALPTATIAGRRRR